MADQRYCLPSTTVRTLILSACLLLASCAGTAKPNEQLCQLDQAQLLEEACSPSARTRGYLYWEPSYRERVLIELAKRSGWSDEDRDKIIAGTPWIGETRDQVLASLGEPTSKSTNVTAAGETSIWQYGKPLRGTTLTFDAGLVVSLLLHDR